MANTLRFKRGLVATIPTAAAGEPLFTTDTFDLYIGNGTGNTRFQKYIASGTTSQLLRGDGSLLTMPIVLTSPANGQVLKYNGTSWVNDSDAGITGSGSAGQVAYFTGATTQAGSNNLFWDATNSRLGIGTNTPSTRLYVTSPSANTTFDSGTATDARLEFRRAGTRISLFNWDTGLAGFQMDTGSYFYLSTGGSERVRLFANGNFGINTGATDSGQRLQVIGTSYFSDSVGIGSTTLTGYGLRINKDITGATSSFGVSVGGQILSGVTSTAALYATNAVTENATFTLTNLTHYRAAQGTLGASSTVTNQYGFFAASSLTGATNDYGFYGDLASATNVWNLYMNGTANNYMAGSLGIGVTVPSYKLDVQGTVGTVGVRSASNTANDILYYATGTVTGSLNAFTTAINATGAVGAQLLNNNSATGSSFLDINVTAASTGDPYLSLTTSGATNWSVGIDNSDSDKLKIGANSNPSVGTPSMTLDASGNLGVGTTSPSRRLSVVGTTDIISYSNGTTTGYLYSDNNGVGLFNGATATGTGIYARTSNILDLYYNGSIGLRLNNLGRILIGSTTDSGEQLQVTGTAKITGASTFGGNVVISLNQNASTNFNVTNTDVGVNTKSEYVLVSRNGGTTKFGRYSNLTTAYKFINASDSYVLNETLGDFAILNDVASGNIKFAAGGSSTAHLTIASTGKVLYAAATTAKAQINLASGTAPTTPVDGDIWFDGTNLKMQIGGVTKTFTLI